MVTPCFGKEKGTSIRKFCIEMVFSDLYGSQYQCPGLPKKRWQKNLDLQSFSKHTNISFKSVIFKVFKSARFTKTLPNPRRSGNLLNLMQVPFYTFTLLRSAQAYQIFSLCISIYLREGFKEIKGPFRRPRLLRPRGPPPPQ